MVILSLLLRHRTVVLNRVLSLCDVEKLFALLVYNFDKILHILKQLWNLIVRVERLHRFESTRKIVDGRL